jgi:hypothetical protein
VGTVVNEGANGDRKVDGRSAHEELPEEVGNFVRKTHIAPREVTVCCPAAVVRVIDVGEDGGNIIVVDDGGGGRRRSRGILLSFPLAKGVDELLGDGNVRVGQGERAGLVRAAVGCLER